MERLSDYLVFCDMDNTLLTAKEGIPACNRSVIRLFTAMGGRFTVASGRPPESIRAALGDIELSLPAISCNGSLLYDFQTNRVLRRSCLNQEQAAAAIADMLQKFPKIGRDNYFLPTNQIYLEIMPSGISKAAGMEELCHILNENIKKTIVIGDYYNDLEIMKKAGYSVAVANAPSEVKAAANEVTNCDCTGGAVGEFLYKLISKVEGV